MRMILVRGYKDGRDRTAIPIANSAHDSYLITGVPDHIRQTLKAQGLSEADIVSMSVVPSEVNQRDRGSTDYYLLCRDPVPAQP